MDIVGKRVLVVGTGISGAAAAKLLINKKTDVWLFDGNRSLDAEAFRKKHKELSETPLILGELTEEQLSSVDIAVFSPGVPADTPLAERMRAHGIAIWGEIELAYRFGKGRVAAITGTNGKTTTTALTAAILGRFFADVRTVGNIGIPYTSEACTMTEDTVTVAEISSFQLETALTFAPEVSAILNITPDHLNRHHTMECYIRTKESITKNQGKGSVCVLNYEDEELRRFGAQCSAAVVWFSSKRRLSEGFYLEDGVIYRAVQGQAEEVVRVNELKILGRHNYENAMAAAAIAYAMGAPAEEIVQGLKEFTAVEHRIEYVAEKRGVQFYNDSKATNVDAAIQGICAMERPTFLIGGGYDKQSEYDAWLEAFDGKVKELVLIGDTAGAIEDCAHRHGFLRTVRLDSLEAAVGYCYDRALPGDAVLLSPACASFGMFANYEERGRRFKEIVRDLKE